eukprot:TRINITY_DN7866_c0_g1_i1.p1 TRINITY_DN7866_c0_g1~~TRINITY_DN7866_c0_g1_i1.p1  ORF type:complete len:548 (+),score=68.82 TRINITY_DN7866_c0_g1_i1:184-1644(+)
MSRKEKKSRVEDIIQVLNLSKAKNTIIGGPLIRGVSGGERKRTNIANELLVSPSLLLTDEPTSGLDHGTALNLLKTLKELAHAGLTVITTIHQPSSQMFHLFDRLVLLIDGSIVYEGDAKKSVDYFAGIGLTVPSYHNPADFMMGLVFNQPNPESRKMFVDQLTDDWKEHRQSSIEKTNTAIKKEASEAKEIADSVTVKKYPTGTISQTLTLGNRAIIQTKGQSLTFINFFQTIAVALITGVLWWQMEPNEARFRDRFGALFFILVFSGGFIPMINSLTSFPLEKVVLIRERASGTYRLSAYFLAKTLTDIPFDFIFPVIFVIISYWMIGLRKQFERFLIFLVVVLVTTFTSSGFGLMLSACVKDLRTALTLSTVTFLIIMLLAGFYVMIHHMPVWIRWTHYLAYLKYGLDALVLNEFEHRHFNSSGERTNFPQYQDGQIPGEAVINTQDVVVYSIVGSIFIIFAWGIFFRVIAFIALKYNYKIKK